jgi:YbbR domain-containing protein
MNKILKPLKKLGKSLYDFVDKFIVTPISTLVYKIGNRLGKEDKLEKLLNRPNFILIISLIFAFVCFLIVDNQATTLVNNEAEILTGLPVNLVYNSSAYVIEGAPETVDVTLIGNRSKLYLARQLGESEVTLDLSDYTDEDGTVRVKLTYNKTIDNLKYKIDPTYATVTIKKKVSSSKNITYDLYNMSKLDDKLSVKSVTLSKDSVVVRGSEEALESIASVKALIDLSDEEFTSAGSYTLDNLTLVPYNNQGEIVKNVEIVATNISATVELDSYSKKVPVKVLTEGKLVDGKAISSIQIDGTDSSSYELTIYGDEASLESIDSVPVTINVDGLGNNGSKTFKVTISKPVGVRYLSSSDVEVVLNLDEAHQRTITLTDIRTRNVPNGLVANLADIKDKEVQVQVVGVESVINGLSDNTSDIEAYVDLTGKAAGTYSVPVKVQGTDSRLTYIVTKEISVVLTKQG